MFNRQIYCNFEGAMIPKWSDTPLTQCPHNPSHSVVLSSESITQAARITSHLTIPFSTSSTTYTTVVQFAYQGTGYYSNDNTSPKYLKIFASIPSGTFDLRIIDPNSNVLWSSTGNSNSTVQAIIADFDLIAVPGDETILIIQTKTSGSTVTIQNAILYSRMIPE
jgi:hypothetical protein